MDFKTIQCHETLRPFIRNYWSLTSFCTATGAQQVFSNGAASLHFYLSQDVRLDVGEQYYHTVFFHQNMQKVSVVSEKGPFNTFGVEFVPFCSRMFFRGEMKGIYASPEELHDEGLIVNKYVGMNPKSYLRLLRFHKALMMIQHETSSPSGDNRMNIAWQCGYQKSDLFCF